MAVHYRQDEESIRLNGIQDGIRKHPGELAAYILLQDRTSKWRVDDTGQCKLDSGHEPLTQTDLLQIVMACAGF